jgi:alpha-galactosidase
MWPSLGLVHGSRSSNDIKRSWDRVMTTARQNLSRNWQNGRLWWNDPDTDHWTGESLGRRQGVLSFEMEPRSARLLRTD